MALFVVCACVFVKREEKKKKKTGREVRTGCVKLPVWGSVGQRMAGILHHGRRAKIFQAPLRGHEFTERLQEVHFQQCDV